MRRKSSEIVTRLCMLSMLAALGFVLMAFAQIPYPFAVWLKVEFSEIVVFIAYALYGFTGSLFVAIVKTALNLLVHGPVGLGIGDITALFTSLVFIFGIFITSHLFKWFKKGWKYRVLAYTFITLLVTIVLTLLNAIFITPSYLTVYGENPHFSTCFDEGTINSVVNYLTGSNSTSTNGWVYIGTIAMIYVPFNLMKSGIVCLIYELIFNRLIFVLGKNSPTFKKYFVGSIFDKKNDEEN